MEIRWIKFRVWKKILYYHGKLIHKSRDFYLSSPASFSFHISMTTYSRRRITVIMAITLNAIISLSDLKLFSCRLIVIVTQLKTRRGLINKNLGIGVFDKSKKASTTKHEKKGGSNTNIHVESIIFSLYGAIRIISSNRNSYKTAHFLKQFRVYMFFYKHNVYKHTETWILLKNKHNISILALDLSCVSKNIF